MPAGSNGRDVEVPQTRDLDVERLLVWYRRTDPYARHRGSGRATLGLARGVLTAVCAGNPVDPGVVNLLRTELELEAFAHHAGEEATHRVLLPAGGLHHCG